MMYWLVVGVSCVAVGIVLMGWGYLVGLKVAARRVKTVREEMAQSRQRIKASLDSWRVHVDFAKPAVLPPGPKKGCIR